jgi:anti-sigma28 factor (negative regulator of flagellin synthesis)
MTINPTSGPGLAPAVTPLAPVREAVDTAPAETVMPRAADRLELAGVSNLLELAKASDVRFEKVQELRAQIETGAYDIEAKVDVVTDRLLDDLDL